MIISISSMLRAFILSSLYSYVLLYFWEDVTCKKERKQTMKVAALYDIHGNLPALEAVLNEIDHEGVDVIVIGGDIVPGPMSRDVLEVL
ncbi:MAG: metallophosphoesterase family protein, partial [Ktedonobacteraceae bacterium]